MIGKIIGAIAGKRAASHIEGIGGAGGAVLGVAASTVLRRLGPAGLVAAVLGGYAWKKYSQRRQAAAQVQPPPAPASAPEPVRTV